MTVLKIGDEAPDFALPAAGSGRVALRDFRDKMVVLYFYPKDNTPGCSIEACSFRNALAGFTARNAVVIGVSRDSAASHDKFTLKYSLPFPLAADTEGSVCRAYGALAEHRLFGIGFGLVRRKTFLIDGDGVVRKIWPKVNVLGHAKEVLQAVEALGSSA